MVRSRILLLLPFFLLPACQMQPGIDQAKVENVKGPKVEGVEGTILESAAQSEKAGDFQRASIFYSQLADQYPNNTDYKVSRADALRKAGKTEEAQQGFETVLAKDPKNVAALEGKMLCRLGQGEQAEAGQLVQQIMAIEPARWRTLNAAAILFASRNMVDEAMAYYERALTVSKDNTSVLNNVGLTLAMDKQYDKAIDALQRASSLAQGATTKQQLDMNLAMVYGISGNMEMAEKVASQYVSGPSLYNNLGYYAKLAKNNGAARDYFNMALTKSPTYYSRAWQNLESVNGKKEAAASDVKVKAGSPIRQTPLSAAKADAPVAEAASEEPKDAEPAETKQPAKPAKGKKAD